jgi:signal transduction histidine kinase/ActR/RegA family two-component response regulator
MNRDRVLNIYIWFVIGVGAVVLAYCIYTVPVAQLDVKYFLFSVLAVLLSARFAIRIPNYSGHITFSDTFIFLVMLFYGGKAAVFLATVEGAYSSIPYRDKYKTIAFNGSIMAIATFVSAEAVAMISGPLTELPKTNMRNFLAAVCAMALVSYITNSGLAAVYTSLSRGQSISHVWSKYYLWSSITYLAGASAAGLTSRVVEHFGLPYVLLTTPIIIIIYLTYRTYLKNIEASAAQAEQAERERMREHYAQIEKLSALGELASGVAHNFNNTLTGILARAQLLLSAQTPEEMRRGLDIIIQTAEDGAKTVKRIQDFARQRRDQDFETIDVDQLMIEVGEITRPRWKDRAEAQNVHITLNRRIGANTSIMGDAGELREVLVNMVFNAVDAMPDGGRLTLSTERVGGEVIISISDTGIGMNDDVRSRIFDPFFTTKGQAGMGLGLSVSYGIIMRHGGTVEVESEVGRGTTFRIRFPVATGTVLPAPAAASASAPAQRRDGLRILVVDDEDYVRELLSDILHLDGCVVSLAADGHEALSLFDGQEFDAVLTDVGLPGMSGWELARYIREQDEHIPLAVITGWGDAVSAEEQIAAKADWVIPKPFSVERITSLVQEISQRKATRDVLAV